MHAPLSPAGSPAQSPPSPASAASIGTLDDSARNSAGGPIRRKPSRRANTAERRATHNAVERQRRETLNGRFLDLAALLPNLASVRRPSKSAIVNSSIALIMAQRRARAIAGRELRGLKAETDAIRRELNEWRDRANLPRVDEVPRAQDYFELLNAEEVAEVGEEERRAYEMRDRGDLGDEDDCADELDDAAGMMVPQQQQQQPAMYHPAPPAQQFAPAPVRLHTAGLAFEPVYDVMQQSPAVHFAPQQQQWAPVPQQPQFAPQPEPYLLASRGYVSQSPPYMTGSDDETSSVGSAPSPRGMVPTVGGLTPGFELATGAGPAEFARGAPYAWPAAPAYGKPVTVGAQYGLIM